MSKVLECLTTVGSETKKRQSFTHFSREALQILRNIPNISMDFHNHHPLHVYCGSLYFISARTYNGVEYFNDDICCRIFLKRFNVLVKHYEFKIFAWVLLHNHYHLLMQINEGQEESKKYLLSEFFRKLHSQTASILNQVDHAPARQIWYQYWDWCIRNEEDFWYHFVYLLQNPLKHGLTTNWPDTFNYKFSSNPQYLKNKGEEYLHDMLAYYPVKDWTPEGCE